MDLIHASTRGPGIAVASHRNRLPFVSVPTHSRTVAETPETQKLKKHSRRALKEIEKLKACRSHWLEFVEEPKHGNK